MEGGWSPTPAQDQALQQPPFSLHRPRSPPPPLEATSSALHIIPGRCTAPPRVVCAGMMRACHAGPTRRLTTSTGRYTSAGEQSAITPPNPATMHVELHSLSHTSTIQHRPNMGTHSRPPDAVANGRYGQQNPHSPTHTGRAPWPAWGAYVRGAVSNGRHRHHAPWSSARHNQSQLCFMACCPPVPARASESADVGS